MATRKHTAPKAQSLDSLTAAARELAPAVEKFLAGISAVLDSQRPAPAATAAEAQHPHPADRTDNQIRAFLASMRPMRDVDFIEPIEEANQRGRSLIERLALSAEGSGDPQLRLTAEQMADVLSFVTCSEPVDLEGWWKDTYDGPSHVCGYQAVLRIIEKTLRGAGEERPAEAPASQSADPVPAIPVSEIEEGFGKYPEPLSVRIMNAAGIIGTARKALDEDRAEESAALAVAVSILHGIDDDLSTACFKAVEAWAAANPDHPDAIERRRILEGMRPTQEAAL